MRLSIFDITCFLLQLQYVLSAPVAGGSPTATIDSGVVLGIQTSLPGSLTPVNKYLGIPFAAPPVRFGPPEPVAPLPTPYDASQYGPACIQQFNYPELSRNATIAWFNTPPPPAGESEDCLNLNVFAPADTSGSLKPVMVWIYGGGLAFGTNSLATYDGSSFAANQGVVLVAINYRTNVFGFPGSDQLQFTGQNLGWQDQKLALSWVQTNIAAFGGDPEQVTIFGESAGAASVDALVTSNPDNPPFRAAIMESGQSSFYGNDANFTGPWRELVAGVNCSSSSDILACVRAVPATTIKSVIEHLALDFGPVRDNITFVTNPAAARRSGNIAQVPILTGTNAQEGRIFTVGQSNLTAFLEATFDFPGADQLYPLIEQAYPIGSPEIANSYDQIALIDTEYAFQCPAAFLANDSAAVGIPTWQYYYNASFANTQLFPYAGIYHSSEIPLVFGTYPTAGATMFESRLSEFMQTAWATFAKNPIGGPGWQSLQTKGVLGTDGGQAYDSVAVPTQDSGQLLRQVPGWTLDQRCALYKAIYQAIGQA